MPQVKDRGQIVLVFFGFFFASVCKNNLVITFKLLRTHMKENLLYTLKSSIMKLKNLYLKLYLFIGD